MNPQPDETPGIGLPPAVRVFIALLLTPFATALTFGATLALLWQAVPACQSIPTHDLLGPMGLALVIAAVVAVGIAAVAGMGRGANPWQKALGRICAVLVVGAPLVEILPLISGGSVTGWCF